MTDRRKVCRPISNYEFFQRVTSARLKTGRALKEKFTLSIIYLTETGIALDAKFPAIQIGESDRSLSRAISAAYAGRLYRTWCDRPRCDTGWIHAWGPVRALRAPAMSALWVAMGVRILLSQVFKQFDRTKFRLASNITRKFLKVLKNHEGLVPRFSTSRISEKRYSGRFL